MRKRENRKINPFDEQSDKPPKQKKVVEKIDFKSLSHEDKVKYAKENFNSDVGLSGEQLDFYNAEILGEQPVTGKSSKFTKAPKPGPKVIDTVEEKKSPNVIKDLGELASLRIEEQGQANEETEKAIEEGENNVAEIVSGIEEDQEKGLNKAEILGDEKGRTYLKEKLKPFTEERTKRIIRLRKDAEEIKEVDEVKTESAPETPELTPADVQKKLETLESNLNDLKNKDKELATLQALENAPAVNTPESKEASIEDVFDSFNEEDEVEYSKLLDAYLEEYSTNKTGLTTDESMNNFHQTEGIQNLLKRIKSRMEKQPTKAEILKKLEEAEKNHAELGKKITEKEAELVKIDNKINGVEDEDDNEELLSPLELDEENEEVLDDVEQNQNSKKEGWLSNQTESVKNAFDKSMDWFTNTEAVKWWNKDYSERTTGEKVAKSLMSAGFIGTALYLSGEKLDLLPKDTSFAGKVGSRTFMAGLASSFLASSTAQKGMEWTKDKLANMSKRQKIVTLGALGVAGAGGFIYFAGIGALATAGAAIGTRIASDKYYFNKQIESKKTGLSTKEQEIAKIKEDIEKIQNETSIEESKKELDINSLVNNLDKIEKDIQKLNSELRKVKTYQSLARGAISFAGGLGTMAVVNATSGTWAGSAKDWLNKDQNISETKDTTIAQESTAGEIKDIQTETKVEAVATDSEIENPNEETKEITAEENKSESWLDKGKKWWAGDKKTETTTITMGEEEYTIENKPSVAKTEEIAENAPKANNGLERMNQANANLEKSVGDLTKTVANMSNGESAPEAPTTDTIENKINIPKEAIIDGKDRVGITYAFRDQLITNKDMANRLGIEHSKLDDAKYVATEMKKLAIKLGYMDNEGHEIRISEDGVNKVAYVLKVDGNGNPMVEETNIATGEVEKHYQGATFEGKDYEKAYETYSDNKYDYRPRVNLGPDNDPVYPGEVTNMSDNSDPVEMSPGYPGAVTDAKNTIDTKLNTEIYNYETVIKSPSWNGFKKDNFLKFINDKNPSYTYSPEEQKIFNFLKADYDKALNKYPGINEYLSNKNVNVEDARKLLHSVNEGGLKAEIIPNTVTDKEISTHDNKEYDYSNNDIEEIRSSNKEFKEIQEVAKSAEYKLTQEELKNVQKVYNKNLETIFGKDKSLWEEGKYQSASKYMKLKDPDPLSEHLNKIKNLGKNYEPKNGWFKNEQIDHYLMRVTIEAEKNGQLELIKPKVDGLDELYQDIKTGKTEVTTRKTVGQKDDAYN